MGSVISDGLTRWQRYRLKNLERYREIKREYAKTPEQKEVRRKYQVKWRLTNNERSNELARESYARNREDILKRNKIKGITKYGITIEQYNNMLEEQNFVCPICKEPPKENNKRLHIDHNHDTGEVRGLLCSKCNGALGWYEKHKEKIESYLNKTDEKRNSRS
jgi:oligoribonuclease NrnB/cAMP/cGMP phosphodiesterase (DHH superfamily)